MGRYATRLGDGLARSLSRSNVLADEIAHRVVLESLLREPLSEMSLPQVFGSSSDSFWFWVFTEGSRRSRVIRNLLPSMPDVDVQLHFNSTSGDAVLREAFLAYVLFRDLYEEHVGPIEACPAILDFGCGWGRILRFFLKDIEPSRLWGVDPSVKMIAICKRDLTACTFQHIDPQVPCPFADETFRLVYAFSVFSHLSEEMHELSLAELIRILQPGGLLVVTTRPRHFIQQCGAARKRKDVSSPPTGPEKNGVAFVDTKQSLKDYDSGSYCYSQLVFEGDWSYWGEAAISEAYVVENWSRHLTLLDYIDDRGRCAQNVIVMQKPGGDTAQSRREVDLRQESNGSRSRRLAVRDI